MSERLAKYGIRNLIINPLQDIWQRGTSFSLGSGKNFVSDRFAINTSGMGTHTYERSTDVPLDSLASYAFRAQADSVGTPGSSGATILQYAVEGYDAREIYNQNFIYALRIKCNKAGIYTVSFSNELTTRTYVTEIEITGSEAASGNYFYKFIKVKHDTTGGGWNDINGRGMLINIWLASGTDYQTATLDQWTNGNGFSESSSVNQVNFFAEISNEFLITEIKLIKGVADIPFEELNRSFDSELSLCKRYYERIDAGVEFDLQAHTYSASTTAYASYVYQETKRDVPVLENSAEANFAVSSANSNGTISGLILHNSDLDKGVLRFVTSVGYGAGQTLSFHFRSNAFIAFDCEI